ncbi:hypothetical protein MOKP151_38640 [Mycobacterium avium subsp. hominissuis]
MTPEASTNRHTFSALIRVSKTWASVGPGTRRRAGLRAAMVVGSETFGSALTGAIPAPSAGRTEFDRPGILRRHRGNAREWSEQTPAQSTLRANYCAAAFLRKGLPI